MHDLFEAWVGTLARTWGASFGGAVRAGREGHVRIPIHWETTGAGSLKELVPDIVVEAGDTVVIIDAKYKAHFEEMDDARWREIAEEIQEEHRRDLHQILAYCAAYDAPRVVAKLVYPMHPATWRRLKEQRRSVTRAIIPGHGRQVELRLAGVPLLLDTPYLCQEIVEAWGPLR
jgi:5-methylcytosine-specific restriction endonuclease McrBC regulatory subunit McrC